MEVEIRDSADITNGKWVRGKSQGLLKYFSLGGCLEDKLIGLFS